MTTVKAINTNRVITVQDNKEIVVVMIADDEYSADVKVIALARSDWDALVGSIA